MKIVLAQSAGFCYGVRRAVELAEEKAAQSVPCVMLGPLIHNKDVTGRLAAQGLRVVNSPEEAPPNENTSGVQKLLAALSEGKCKGIKGATAYKVAQFAAEMGLI